MELFKSMGRGFNYIFSPIVLVLKHWVNSVYSCLLRVASEIIEFIAEWFGLIALLFGLFCVVWGVYLVWGLGISLIVFGLISAILGVLYNMGEKN